MQSYTSRKYPEVPLLFNEDVSKNRLILIHGGNRFEQTAGCLLPGLYETYVEGEYTVWKSGAALNSIKKHITTCGGYKNVSLSIFDILGSDDQKN